MFSMQGFLVGNYMQGDMDVIDAMKFHLLG